MRIASLSDVKARFSMFVDGASREGPVVITRNGKAVAVLIAPADGDELERLILAYSPRFREILEQSEKSIREGKGLSWDQVMAQVDRLSGNVCGLGEPSGMEGTPEPLAVTEESPAYRTRRKRASSAD
jgi:prevent-host-death family protein